MAERIAAAAVANPAPSATDALTLQQVLAVEDDAAFAQTADGASGVLLWPLVRVLYLRVILSDLLYGMPISGPSSHRTPARRTAAALARASLHNLANRRLRSPHEVIVMPSGAGNILVEGRWFNRLGGYFARAFPSKTLSIEERLFSNWPFPRHDGDFLFHQPLRLRSMIAERVRARGPRPAAATALIELARERGRRLLGWDCSDAERDWLAMQLHRRMIALPLLLRAYERLFRAVRPGLVVVEEGCYGGHYVPLIAAARSLGIVTAEYQHGAVSAGHDAYNVAPALARSDAYRATLPDYFLGYGRWWNEQINVPVEKIALGNPHRTEQLGATGGEPAGERRDILLLGDGMETGLYLDLAARLAALCPEGARVVFRPHPLERARVRQMVEARTSPEGVVIDPHGDIYTSFRTARVAVSEVSTGLFEAIGLVERIFIWDTPKARFGYPAHPFQRFETAHELAAMLAEPARGRLGPHEVEAIWAGGWEENYRRFVGAVIRR